MTRQTPLTITVDPQEELGPIRIMNAVNNGPIKARKDQRRDNMDLWRAAEIPYARNHDAAFCSLYGGEHTVDIQAVFPDFSKDPDDPDSYDFTLTDWYIQNTLEGNTGIFYRLGSKIEHAPKKYGTKVPTDFRKWAVICEHIIRHCNEGWADGSHLDIRYWEIWNEPDAGEFGITATWQGSSEQFFEFYRVAATHLKQCFPNLKIGGPALGGSLPWMERFLQSMTQGEKVPFDFFSWHWYGVLPQKAADKAVLVRKMLDRFGYTATESILNEWNYVRNWSEHFVYSIRTIIGLKGAVFTASVMSACQDSPTDMLMYYDARPCVFNGLFDYYTYEPLKGYYPFLAWARLRKLGTQVAVNTGNETGIFATAAAGSNGAVGILVCRYFEDDELPGPESITLKVVGTSLDGAVLRLLDEENDFTEVPCGVNPDGSVTLSMRANTLIYIEKRSCQK